MAVNVAALVQQAFVTAGSVAGDVVVAGTYHHVTGPTTVDPVTDKPVTPTQEYPLPRVMVTNYRDREIDGERIRAKDRRLLIAVADLPIQPKLSDTVTVRGEKLNVVSAVQDPSNSLHTLQVRGP